MSLWKSPRKSRRYKHLHSSGSLEAIRRSRQTADKDRTERTSNSRKIRSFSSSGRTINPNTSGRFSAKRRKEKQHVLLSKEHPGLPHTVDKSCHMFLSIEVTGGSVDYPRMYHLCRLSHEDRKFKASLCYIAILRPAWATQWVPVSKNKKIKFF
jgi:hypothetical protein